MNVVKLSKATFLSTLLIVVAMLTAHKLEDLIGDSLLARFAPSTSAVIERSGDKIEHVEKTNESDVLVAGVILYGVEIVVKVGVSYLFACIIVHFFFDRKLRASNQARPRGFDEA